MAAHDCHKMILTTDITRPTSHCNQYGCSSLSVCWMSPHGKPGNLSSSPWKILPGIRWCFLIRFWMVCCTWSNKTQSALRSLQLGPHKVIMLLQWTNAIACNQTVLCKLYITSVHRGDIASNRTDPILTFSNNVAITSSQGWSLLM